MDLQASSLPLGLPASLARRWVEAGSDAFLLLTVHIALQNELDNTRAQLSQKGELAREKEPWEAPDMGAGGRGWEEGLQLSGGARGSPCFVCPRVLPALVIGRKGEERAVAKSVYPEQVSLCSFSGVSCPGPRLEGDHLMGQNICRRELGLWVWQEPD